MLNYETLLSSYDDKLTLMQWLKKVEAALKDASAVSFKVNKKGNATLTFSIVFEDGSEIESGEIVLQQGESVESAAIVNGHLILTLTNGDELDAGQLLNGDLNVNGNLAVSGNIASNGKITGGEIVEDMTGYRYAETGKEGFTQEAIYSGVVKNGNKLTLCAAVNLTRTQNDLTGSYQIGRFYIPASVWNKLYEAQIGSFNYLAVQKLTIFTSAWQSIDIYVYISKSAGNLITFNIDSSINNAAVLNSKYYIRVEATFLLSENLAA